MVCGLAATLAGCTTPDFWRRFAFQALQNVHYQQCLRDPAMECSHQPSYDQYQRYRREVERDE